MSEQHGVTHASNRRGTKDGWGPSIPAPIRPDITLIIPNRKAKHRSGGDGIVWKYQRQYLLNRWYVVGRPAYRRLLKRLNLR